MKFYHFGILQHADLQAEKQGKGAKKGRDKQLSHKRILLNVFHLYNLALFFFLSFSYYIKLQEMITYFIINKLGTVVYQSTSTKKHLSSNATAANESQRIRYLPLLVIKDLIKANLNDVIQYIRVGNKTVAFREVSAPYCRRCVGIDRHCIRCSNKISCI